MYCSKLASSFGSTEHLGSDEGGALAHGAQLGACDIRGQMAHAAGDFRSRTDSAYQMALWSSARCSAPIARAPTRGAYGRGKSVVGAASTQFCLWGFIFACDPSQGWSPLQPATKF